MPLARSLDPQQPGSSPGFAVSAGTAPNPAHGPGPGSARSRASPAPGPSSSPARASLALLLSLLLGLACALALGGCRRSFYAASGPVASHGGPLGRWSLRPDGCSRAPFDGLPPPQSSSLVEFVWQRGRPSEWTPHGIEDRWAQGPSVLDLAHAPDGVSGSLQLVQTRAPVLLNTSVCRRLQLDSHPGPPIVPAGPPSLAGRLQLDCNVDGSQITADITFRGCVF